MSERAHFSPVRRLPATVIVVIGVCYLLISSSLSFLGDDLSFFKRTEPYAGSNFYLYYKHVAAMWFGSNGRLQNVIAPALFQYVPPVVLWIVNASAVGLLFFMVLKWCSQRSAAAQLAVMCVVAFGLPWWDMFLLFDVNIGYTGGMALALLALWLFFREEPLPQSFCVKSALFLLGTIASGMHEALGLPMCLSLFACLYLSGGCSRLDAARKWMLAGIIVGTLYCSLSPGIRSRIGDDGWVNDGPWWKLLLVSSYFVLMLIAAVVAVRFRRRDVIRRLSRTHWSVFVMMSLLSLPIVAVGGIIGRSGFFGQVPAVIALVILLREQARDFRLSRPFSVILASFLALVLLIHYLEFTRYQLRMNREVRAAISGYLASPTGAVYMDCTDEPDLPWYVLRKTRGVPDADDFYLCTSLTKWIGTPGRPFTVLPSALKELDPDTLTSDFQVGDGYVTLRTPGREMPDAAGRRLIERSGRPDSIAVPIPGSRAYYVTERDLDPSGSY